MEELYRLKKEVLVEWTHTAALLETKMAEDLSAFELTPQQFNVLRILRGALPEMLCAKVIKERLVDRNADVSRLLGRLEEKAFVKLENSKQDRRQKDVYLMDAGKEILSKIDQKHPQYPYSFLNCFSEEELNQLKTLFQKFKS